ncbi:MAG: hypothetical protein K9G70_13500 [Prolixibacteraceae bacterium]|nr:hypothetical protein [Prolixibacteraceae bacterium]
MDLQTTKLSLMQKIMNVSSTYLLHKINNILDQEMIVGYTADGKPLNTTQYNNRLQEAEKQIEKSNFSAHEDLKKEIDTWQ